MFGMVGEKTVLIRICEKRLAPRACPSIRRTMNSSRLAKCSYEAGIDVMASVLAWGA